MAHRLIFIDDDEDIIESFTQVLRKEPYELTCCSHPLASFELVTRLNPQIVVSDYRMQWMDGVDVLDKVRSMAPNTIRLLMSGMPDDPKVVDAIRRGTLHRVLFKPWKSEELRQELKQWFEFHRTRDPNVLYKKAG